MAWQLSPSLWRCFASMVIDALVVDRRSLGPATLWLAGSEISARSRATFNDSLTSPLDPTSSVDLKDFPLPRHGSSNDFVGLTRNQFYQSEDKFYHICSHDDIPI